MKLNNRFYRHERMCARVTIEDWIKSSEDLNDKELMRGILDADKRAEGRIASNERHYVAAMKKGQLAVGVSETMTSLERKQIAKTGAHILLESDNILQFTRELRKIVKRKGITLGESMSGEGPTPIFEEEDIENALKKAIARGKADKKELKEAFAKGKANKTPPKQNAGNEYIAEAPLWVQKIMLEADAHTGVLTQDKPHPTRTVLIFASEDGDGGGSMIVSGGDMTKIAENLIRYLSQEEMKGYLEKVAERLAIMKLLNMGKPK